MRAWALAGLLAAGELQGAARVVALEGEGKLALGQLLEAGAEAATGRDGSAHLILDDGSSLVLGPESALLLSRNGAELRRGRLWAQAEGPLELRAGNLALVSAAAGGALELQMEGDGARLALLEGTASLSDPQGRRSLPVAAGEQASAGPGRLEGAFRLPKRELGELKERAARPQRIHQARASLLRHYEGGGVKERRREARERFQKARDEIRRERSRKEPAP